MARVTRPAEDAVLQALRRELEPHGFTYKARKLITQSDQWSILVYIQRARWIEPDEEIFDILVDYDMVSAIKGARGGTILSLATAVRDGVLYGQSPLSDGPVPVEPGSIVEDFRLTMLPVILEHDSPQAFTRALLADDIEPGVPHFLSRRDRAYRGYSFAEFLGFDDLARQAVDQLRDLARNPAEREAVLFAWRTLDLPGSPN